ncbi:MAG: hypothetical protein HRU35_04875 [Rickettsiaceae bacterium]|nr:hypothetical protein [Rickettsiaceae bacterium]
MSKIRQQLSQQVNFNNKPLKPDYSNSQSTKKHHLVIDGHKNPNICILDAFDPIKSNKNINGIVIKNILLGDYVSGIYNDMPPTQTITKPKLNLKTLENVIKDNPQIKYVTLDCGLSVLDIVSLSLENLSYIDVSGSSNELFYKEPNSEYINDFRTFCSSPNKEVTFKISHPSHTAIKDVGVIRAYNDFHNVEMNHVPGFGNISSIVEINLSLGKKAIFGLDLNHIINNYAFFKEVLHNKHEFSEIVFKDINLAPATYDIPNSECNYFLKILKLCSDSLKSLTLQNIDIGDDDNLDGFENLMQQFSQLKELKFDGASMGSYFDPQFISLLQSLYNQEIESLEFKNLSFSDIKTMKNLIRHIPTEHLEKLIFSNIIVNGSGINYNDIPLEKCIIKMLTTKLKNTDVYFGGNLVECNPQIKDFMISREKEYVKPQILDTLAKWFNNTKYFNKIVSNDYALNLIVEFLYVPGEDNCGVTSYHNNLYGLYHILPVLELQNHTCGNDDEEGTDYVGVAYNDNQITYIE